MNDYFLGAARSPGRVLAAALGPTAAGSLQSVCDELITAMGQVNAARRQAARAMYLINGNRAARLPDAEKMSRALGAWSSCLSILRRFVDSLTQEAIKAADDLIAEGDNPTEIIADLLKVVVTVGMGFSSAEFDWLIDQFRRCGFRMLFLLSEGDPAVLQSLVAAALGGDGGINQIGFVTFSDDVQINRHVEAAMVRAVKLGITPSIFHLLPAAILSIASIGVTETTALGQIMARVRQDALIIARRDWSP